MKNNNNKIMNNFKINKVITIKLLSINRNPCRTNENRLNKFLKLLQNGENLLL
jgi:hypothetical protein